MNAIERDAVRRLGGRLPFPWREFLVALVFLPIIWLEEQVGWFATVLTILGAVIFILLWTTATP